MTSLLQRLKTVVPGDSITIELEDGQVQENGTILFAMFPNQIPRRSGGKLSVKATKRAYETFRDIVYDIPRSETDRAYAEDLIQAIQIAVSLDVVDGYASDLPVIEDAISRLRRVSAKVLYDLALELPSTTKTCCPALDDFFKMVLFKRYASTVTDLQKYRPLPDELGYGALLGAFIRQTTDIKSFMVYLDYAILYQRGEEILQTFNFVPSTLKGTSTPALPDLLAWKATRKIVAEELVDDYSNLVPLPLMKALVCYWNFVVNGSKLKEMHKSDPLVVRLGRSTETIHRKIHSSLDASKEVRVGLVRDILDVPKEVLHQGWAFADGDMLVSRNKTQNVKLATEGGHTCLAGENISVAAFVRYHSLLSPLLIKLCSEHPKETGEDSVTWFKRIKALKRVLIPEYLDQLRTRISRDSVGELCSLTRERVQGKFIVLPQEKGKFVIVSIDTGLEVERFEKDDPKPLLAYWSKLLPAEFTEEVALFILAEESSSKPLEADKRDQLETWFSLQGRLYFAE